MNSSEVKPNDILTMKKPHPCGCRDFLVLRIGIDLKLRCVGCGHEVSVPRTKIEKNIKKITHPENDDV